MANDPASVANQALDAIGSDVVIGALEEGTREAQVCLRAYGQVMRQLLRAVHWNFARRQTSMVLLADSSGQTPNVGTIVPVPWRFEYAYPIDCMKARFVPWNLSTNAVAIPPGNIVPVNPNAPLTSAGSVMPFVANRLKPARWLEMTDPNYPAPPGLTSWDVQGSSPQGSTVILTDVPQATLVYTALMIYPSNWDAQFRAAFVAYLASEIALPVWSRKDRKFGLQMRGEQIAIAKAKITQARVTDGNEAFTSTDFATDWIQFRRAGGRTGWGDGVAGGGPGGFWGGYDTCGFGDGTAY